MNTFKRKRIKNWLLLIAVLIINSTFAQEIMPVIRFEFNTKVKTTKK
jgi:hypothetical protein